MHHLSILNRGVAKINLGDNSGAIFDYSKAIEINPNYLDAYINLGVEKNKVGEMKGACFNWTKASGLGDEDATKWVKEYCQ